MAGKAASVDTARAAQGAADRAAILDRIRSKRPIRGEYRIQLSDEPVAAVHEARSELRRREDGLLDANEATLEFAQQRVHDAEETLAKALAEANADSVLLVFEGLPRDAFHALLDEHQPDEAGDDKGKDYDPKTFPPALIAATCVDPGFDSAEQVAELIESWNVTEREALFTVAMGTCLATRVADWGKGFAATRT